MSLATGYFGIPGRNGGKVHIVRDGKPVCRVRLHAKSEFQWCASGVYTSYIECRGCLKSKEYRDATKALYDAYQNAVKKQRS